MGFGFWILGFGFWVLDFGFWVLDFGFWILGFGFWVLDFGFWVLDFGFFWGPWRPLEIGGLQGPEGPLTRPLQPFKARAPGPTRWRPLKTPGHLRPFGGPGGLWRALEALEAPGGPCSRLEAVEVYGGPGFGGP